MSTTDENRLNDKPEGYLIFIIAGQEYGINMESVYSIINPLDNYTLEEIVEIKSRSIVIKNKEIPIINFYDLYNLKSPPQSKDTRIIVVNINEIKTAFYVDRIKELIAVGISSDPPPTLTSVSENPFIKCQLEFGDRHVLMPDIEKMVSDKS